MSSRLQMAVNVKMRTRTAWFRSLLSTLDPNAVASKASTKGRRTLIEEPTTCVGL